MNRLLLFTKKLTPIKKLLMMKAVAGEKGGLPSAYQQVEYLKGAGSQILQLGIPFITDIEFEIVCQSDDTTATQIAVGYGISAGRWFGTYNGKYSNGTRKFDDINITDKITCVLKYTSTSLEATIGDTKIDGMNYAAGDPRDLTIFGGQGTSSAFVYGSLKIFSFKSPGVINLIPCVRKSDSKPGMYDTVTKTFFTNAGTGEFIIPT